MSEPTEADYHTAWRITGEFCDNGTKPVPTMLGHCGPCALVHQIAAAQAKTREEGERIGEARARGACHDVAEHIAQAYGGTAGAVAIRISELGPMEPKP